MRRPEYVTAFLFVERSTDLPAWLLTKYAGQTPPAHRFHHYAMAIDGEFWRWMDRDRFDEMFVAVAS